MNALTGSMRPHGELGSFPVSLYQRTTLLLKPQQGTTYVGVSPTLFDEMVLPGSTVIGAAVAPGMDIPCERLWNGVP
jgi:hypothetical protein